MEWRPIETAPRDGTHILTVSKKGFMVACWREGWSGLYTVPGTYQTYPTHWMPLPEPPHD